MRHMINITVYTSLDKGGIEDIEVRAKELALLLSYYTGEKVNLNMIITPLSSPEILIPSVRVNELLFKHFDVSEIIARLIIDNTMFPTLPNRGVDVVPIF